MGFLEIAGEGLSSAVDSRIDPWVDKGLVKLRTDMTPRLGADSAAITNGVIDKIAAKKGALVGLSHAGAIMIAGYLAVDAEDEARVTWLRDQATFDEGQDALKQATRASLQKNADDAAAWAETKALLLDILQYAGKAAFPILMAMI